MGRKIEMLRGRKEVRKKRRMEERIKRKGKIRDKEGRDKIN
jgi:hypothetical protein